MKYVYRNGELVPKDRGPTGLLVISDIEPFQTQDGAVIGSRRHLREYEQRMGVRQIGNDWTGPEQPRWWDKLQERRDRRGGRD